MSALTDLVAIVWPWLAGGVYLFYATFIYYLALMNLKRARDLGQLTWPAKLFGFPALGVGYLLDALLTTTVGFLLFCDAPRELTFSHRLERYCTEPEYEGSWRRRFAIWLAKHFLNPYDPRGYHIKGST